jgi:TonB family protein
MREIDFVAHQFFVFLNRNRGFGFFSELRSRFWTILVSFFIHGVVFVALTLSWRSAPLFPQGGEVEQQIGGSHQVIEFVPIRVETAIPEVKDFATETIAVKPRSKRHQPRVSSQPQSRPAPKVGNAERGESHRLGKTQAREGSIKARYLYELRQVIDSHKQYPRSARRLRQEGVVTVGFRIGRNGQLSEVKVLKKCPFWRLNEAAMETVKSIGAFPPLPQEIQKESWELSVPIRFEITSVYL